MSRRDKDNRESPLAAVDCDAMAADIRILHQRAAGLDGRLVLASFGEDFDGRKLHPKVQSFHIGDAGNMSARAKHLVGAFNRHLMEMLLVLADEAFFANEKRYAGVLKNLVTQSRMLVEPKGVNAFPAKKYFRLFMASNEDFVVPVARDQAHLIRGGSELL